MNAICKNIIEKSVIGILIYAGKRLVDKAIAWCSEKGKSKDPKPTNYIVEETGKNIKSMSLKEIIDQSKSLNKQEPQRGLFAEGELHVICAQTGMGKSILAVQMGLAIAGGKGSDHYAKIKEIFGDNWNATKQRVDYIEGENGKDEIRKRYGNVDINYPDTFSVTPAGEIYTIDELESYIRQRAEESKNKENRTIIIDHPGCYEGSDNHKRMQKFYQSLKTIILNYRQGGYYLTIIVVGFVDTDKPWKPVYYTNITGSSELSTIAHTIVALCPCNLGEEYRFLKILKSRSSEPLTEVFILKKSTEKGLFFHFTNKMKEKDALPLKARKEERVLFTNAGSSISTGAKLFSTEEEQSATGSVKSVPEKRDKRKKVTSEILSQIKQMYDEGMSQQKIADILQLCRKTVNQYIQEIKQEECTSALSSSLCVSQ